VPATTRTIEQFGRIQLPGAPWRYAITSNGGNILIDGRPDRQWRSAVDAAVRAGGPELPEVVTELCRRIGSDWVEACRTADDLFCYLVVKPVAVPTDFLDQWSRWCAKRGWGVSQQGRKIYTMPIAVCKSHAVTEIRCRMLDDRTLGADALVLTAGDGALDAQMLALADAGIRPRHGELESLGWIHPTVTVTMASGIRASVEILRWFDTRAVTPRVPPRSAAPSAE
jgi:hypothetical protein